MTCECLRTRQMPQGNDQVTQLRAAQAQAQQFADLAPAPQAAEQMPAAADGAGPAAAGLVERLLALEITLQRIVDAEAPQRRRMQERMVALEQIETQHINRVEGLQLRIVALEEANADLRTRMREALSG